MATATKNRTASNKSPRKTASKKGAAKKASGKKAATKKSVSKRSSTKTNKLGVKNSLVNNINAHKKKGDSKPKKKSTVAKKQYKKMKNDWDEK